jgi:hypothetical protein
VEPRDTARQRFGPWTIGLVAAVGISLIFAVTVWAAHAQPTSTGQSAAEKLAKLHQVDAQQTAAAESWHAPKRTPTAAPTVASCPRYSLPTGIYYGDTGGFHEYITNSAVIAPSNNQPFEYIIYAGAYAADPQQGLLIVMRLDGDTCANGITGTQINFHATPMRQGKVTLTQVSGAVVRFTTANGGSGQFDCASGQFG